jgi:hypothetical protein
MKITILITIILLTFHCCLLGENNTESEVPTGDIMVAADCCFLRPYEFGLRLELNKLPDPGARDYPPDLFERKDWYEYLKDSIGDSADIVKFYLYDSLNMSEKLVSDLHGMSFREAVSDSLGRYIFYDVPIGRYQLICYENQILDKKKTLSDSLYSERTDFPIEPYSDFIQGLIDTLGIDSARILIGLSFHKNVFNVGSRCRSGVMNDIRVAVDSIAVINIECYESNDQNPFIQINIWKEQYRKKEKSK